MWFDEKGLSFARWYLDTLAGSIKDPDTYSILQKETTHLRSAIRLFEYLDQTFEKNQIDPILNTAINEIGISPHLLGQAINKLGLLETKKLVLEIYCRPAMQFPRGRRAYCTKALEYAMADRAIQADNPTEIINQQQKDTCINGSTR